MLISFQDEDADDDEEYEEAYAGSDDDDSSWKVRKAAVKVLAVIITARPELQNQLYESCGDDLLGRFKEREENVRLDIINCYALLIKSSSASGALMKDGDYNTSVTATAISLSPVPLKRQRSCVNLLEERVSIIVTLCCSQLAQSSLKTKSAVFHLLQALVCALKVK